MKKYKVTIIDNGKYTVSYFEAEDYLRAEGEAGLIADDYYLKHCKKGQIVEGVEQVTFSYRIEEV